jgi:hypothetical protein
MRYDRLEHTDQDLELRREPGLGAPAGVFLLDGEFHVAAFATRAAERLHALGALLVAALHFDPMTAALTAAGGTRAGEPPVPLRVLRAPGDLPALNGPSGRN